MTNTNTDIRKLTEQEAANTAGGVEGYNYGNGWRTVMNLQGGYLAIRTAPSFKYENEIIHNGPRNGQLVQIVGEYVQGTGMNGMPATYVRVYSPDFGGNWPASGNPSKKLTENLSARRQRCCLFFYV